MRKRSSTFLATRLTLGRELQTLTVPALLRTQGRGATQPSPKKRPPQPRTTPFMQAAHRLPFRRQQEQRERWEEQPPL
jgi:hypothetical protein